MKREFLQNLRVGDQPLPKEVIDAIMEENGKDIHAGKVWQEKYNQAVSQHQQQMDEIRFSNTLQMEIAQAGGRNAKAISALLDMDSLRSDANPQAAVKQALGELKKENDYLFSQPQVPPAYASGTGAQNGAPNQTPTTLAGALRERFEINR